MALIHQEDLPTPEVKLEILKSSIEQLTDAGYIFIGMDHFAKPDDELSIALKEKKLYRNFQGYSTNAGTDLYAMGITSISQLKNIYAQNYKTEKEYYKSLDDGIIPTVKGYKLSEDDHIRSEVIMRLMCDFELDFKSIEEKYNINFENYFAKGLNSTEGGLGEMQNDGLVEMSDTGILVKDMGRLLIRNIAMNFDGYIERKEDKAKYSRTV
jgi:oxygen-independent coproporphyrinogen-3 oxidase